MLEFKFFLLTQKQIVTNAIISVLSYISPQGRLSLYVLFMGEFVGRNSGYIQSRRSPADGCSAGSKAVGDCGSEHRRAPEEKKNSILPLQTGHPAVETILVSRNGTGTPNAYPPLKSIAGYLWYILDNCEVWLNSQIFHLHCLLSR